MITSRIFDPKYPEIKEYSLVSEKLIVNIINMGATITSVICQKQEHDMPKLPVAGVLWKPLPNLETSAEAWMYAGGAHHSVISYDLDAEVLQDFAEIMNMEFIHIGADTTIPALRKELTWNDLIWKLKK